MVSRAFTALRRHVRRHPVVLPAVVILLPLLSGLLRAAGGSAASRRSERPNILFLLTDDQRWDALGCAGNPVIYTPNLDALARRGVRFRNAFATTPICAASRASLLTGLYERSHRHTFDTPPLSKAAIEQSYPFRLRRAGYRTGLVGKFGVEVPEGSSAKMFDFLRQVPLPYYSYLHGDFHRHGSEFTREAAQEFLRGCRPDQPFCLSISFNSPHTDTSRRCYVPPPEEEPLYRGVTFPPPKTMAPAFFEAQPEFLKKSLARIRWRNRFDDPDLYQQRVRDYYRMVSGVDRNVGRILATLEERGLADNTIVVFTSDNGSALGARGFAGKWFGYEYSLRVPMIVYDPRLPEKQRGQVVDRMALNVDLPASLLDLAGLPVPPRYQGRSVAPLLRGERPDDWREEFLFEHHYDHPQIPKSEGVRTERWTYIRWYEQRPVVEELYDHQADFDETKNLVRQPEFKAVLSQLRQRTDQLAAAYASAPRELVAAEVPGDSAAARSGAE